MPQRLPTPPGVLPLALGLLKPGRRVAPGAPAPEVELAVDRVDVEPARLRAWRAACGYDPGDRLPAVPLPYLFTLAYDSQAKLLLDPAFPPSPLGMVHIACALELRGELRAGDVLSLELSLLDWRRVRRGREVDVEIRYLKGGHEVARGVQTSLGRGGGTGEPAPAPPRPIPPAARPGPPTGDDVEIDTWAFEADAGRRYARVSGDWNPIHLWPLTAWPFGYRRPILHGMALVARAAAALDPSGRDAGHRLDVRFKTPAELPGEVRCYRRGGRFELWRGDDSRPHAVGERRAL